MLRSLFLTGIYLLFLVLGASAPFIFSLGYLWVDTFTPQNIAWLALPDLPLSYIMGAAAVGSYLLFDRRAAPSLNTVTVLTVLLVVWVTLSTWLWAVVPDSAWAKWNPAFKTIAFSALIPYIFRSRIQIEAFVQIYVFSLCVQFLPVGIKTLISGGGYGINLGIIAGNSGLSEGSTLAAVSLMLVPLILFLRRHTSIIPRSGFVRWMFVALAGGALSAAFGTFARTALIGLVVLGLGLWLRARHKVTLALLATCVAVALIPLSSTAWESRVATTADYATEGSALGRILVWEWTLGFVMDHPLGGGFNAYQINRIVFPGEDADVDPIAVTGKAFHSIYFEMLGEQGWVGLGIFLGLIVASLRKLQGAAKLARGEDDLAWCRDLAQALQISLLTLLACGAFIGIAFQPMLYYLFALSVSVANHASAVRGARSSTRLPATRFAALAMSSASTPARAPKRLKQIRDH